MLLFFEKKGNQKKLKILALSGWKFRYAVRMTHRNIPAYISMSFCHARRLSFYAYFYFSPAFFVFLPNQIVHKVYQTLHFVSLCLEVFPPM